MMAVHHSAHPGAVARPGVQLVEARNGIFVSRKTKDD